MSQRGGYSKKLIENVDMKDANPVSTPVDTSIKLTKDGKQTDGVDHGLYQSAVGSLLYLSLWTRPDITYALSCLARFFCANPLKQWRYRAGHSVASSARAGTSIPGHITEQKLC